MKPETKLKNKNKNEIENENENEKENKKEFSFFFLFCFSFSFWFLFLLSKSFCIFVNSTWSRGAIDVQMCLDWPKSAIVFSFVDFPRGLTVP